MAAFEKKFILTAIGANSVDLTPQLGTNSSGPVSGTLPTSDQDVQGGLTKIVVNFSGTPDNKVFKTIGSVVNIEIGTDGA
jgi:hypothetical protein